MADEPSAAASCAKTTAPIHHTYFTAPAPRHDQRTYNTARYASLANVELIAFRILGVWFKTLLCASRCLSLATAALRMYFRDVEAVREQLRRFSFQRDPDCACCSLDLSIVLLLPVPHNHSSDHPCCLQSWCVGACTQSPVSSIGA